MASPEPATAPGTADSSASPDATTTTPSPSTSPAKRLSTSGPPEPPPQDRPSIVPSTSTAAEAGLPSSPLSQQRKTSTVTAVPGSPLASPATAGHRKSTVPGAPGSPPTVGAAAAEGPPSSAQHRQSVVAGLGSVTGPEGSPLGESSVQPAAPGAAAAPTGSPLSSSQAQSPTAGAGTARQSVSGSTGGSSTAPARKTPPTIGWDYNTPLPNCYFRPSLTDLCFPVLAKNFAKFPGFGSLPAVERLRVVNEIALDLPLKLAADLIPEEAYWKRRVQARWRNCDIAAHGCSWKQLFFERNLAEALERFDRTLERESNLVELMKISAPYVHNLDISELPSHLSFLTIFNILHSDLVVLRVRFGNPNSGWNYNRKKWGMKRSDCLSMSAAMSVTTTLTSLHLSGNRLDPEKMGILVKGLMANPTVVDLDLSCNSLSDDGVREVAKLVNAKNSVLGMLSLASNSITARGCAYLAECEDMNKSLVSLNLCFNLFGDLGGKRIIDWASNNTSIQRLNIESCNIGEDSAQSFVRLMHNTHSALTSINMSGNRAIGVKNGELLLAGLEAGKQMKELWISNCGCGAELESKILTFLVERLFGRTCFHHPGVRDIPAEPTPHGESEKEAKLTEEEAKKKEEDAKKKEEAKKQEEDKEKEEAENNEEVYEEVYEEVHEEDEEEKKETEKAEKAEKEEATAAAEADSTKVHTDDAGIFHVGHGHDEACTLECSHMVGLPSTKPPPEPVVYPATAYASRDAQSAIKEIQDAKPYWGLGAIKDLKEKSEPE